MTNISILVNQPPVHGDVVINAIGLLRLVGLIINPEELKLFPKCYDIFTEVISANS